MQLRHEISMNMHVLKPKGALHCSDVQYAAISCMHHCKHADKPRVSHCMLFAETTFVPHLMRCFYTVNQHGRHT